MTELLNDEAVCRTAPATSGLLIMGFTTDVTERRRRAGQARFLIGLQTGTKQ